MPASPSALNYTIFKAIVYIKLAGESAYRDVGNVPVATFTPSNETLDHFSSRTGVRTKDKQIVLSKSGTLAITFEEMTPENLALALLGDIAVNSAGETELAIFSQNSLSGAVKIEGQNEVGAKVRAIFNNVTFNPNSEIPFISDEWAQIELSGEVLVDGNGDFGTYAFIGEEATA